MDFFKKNDLTHFVINCDKSWIEKKAKKAVFCKEEYLPDYVDPDCPGTPSDYSSYGDYWWPDPGTTHGLPFMRRDGESNPDLFDHHRRILREFRTTVSHLTAGCLVHSNEEWGKMAIQRLERFFVDPATRMNPDLLYAQSIPGICLGRGTGIIDTLHLIEVPVAANLLEKKGLLSAELGLALREWFAFYLKWICEHPQGIHEMNANSNHGVCWLLQAAVFARYTNNSEILDFCRIKFINEVLPIQMNEKGGFTKELGRTKPYGYSLFVLDQFYHLCYVLSDEKNDLWEYSLDDNRSVHKGLDFMYPYMLNKESWFLPPDVEHFEPWPVRQSALLFGAMAYGKEEYINLWSKLDRDPMDKEIRRNLAVRQSVLWVL